jgi:hypothetical protein
LIRFVEDDADVIHVAAREADRHELERKRMEHPPRRALLGAPAGATYRPIYDHGDATTAGASEVE